jgi:hypothetical protein
LFPHAKLIRFSGNFACLNCIFAELKFTIISPAMTEFFRYLPLTLPVKSKIIYKLFIKCLVINILFTGCSAKTDLPGFDKTGWKKDVRSCKNIRPALVANLKKNRSKIIGLRHNQIIDLLGKPEGSSLEKSGERIYYYFIQPGSQCEKNDLSSKAGKVYIHFDALDRAYKLKFDSSM